MPESGIVSILLVEDDPGDQKLIKFSLESLMIDNEVYTRSSAEEALDFLRRCGQPNYPKRFDLILLDLNMPGMGGMEFLKIIKEDDKLRSIPVVILTTSDSDHDILRGYKLQAAGYVMKPPRVIELHDIFKQIGNYWFLTCKRPQVMN
ncbi:response regulator [bacterium]|nr:response regulator [bacterium]